MPSVVDSGVADLGLGQDGLPGPPVLGAFDRSPATSCEYQIMVRPRTARPQPLGGLPLAVLLQQLQERGRALESELALALALPEDDAALCTVRALVGVAGAVGRARPKPPLAAACEAG